MAQNIDPERDTIEVASGDKHSDGSRQIKDNHTVSKRFVTCVSLFLFE